MEKKIRFRDSEICVEEERTCSSYTVAAFPWIIVVSFGSPFNESPHIYFFLRNVMVAIGYVCALLMPPNQSLCLGRPWTVSPT